METLKSKLASRKFILALAGALVPVLNTLLPIPLSETEVAMVLGILATYIGAEAIVDARRD